MSDEWINGLDSKGFIINPCSLDYLQPEFKPYLENTIQTLEATFGNQLHSVILIWQRRERKRARVCV